MDIFQILIGITEIAIALTGFAGMVVAFGSRQLNAWHSGDKLRLAFLLEASLSSAAFSLLALLILSITENQPHTWRILSSIWIGATLISLSRAHIRLKNKRNTLRNNDRLGNSLTSFCFALALLFQIYNIISWHQFAPFLGAILLNLAGAAMQFARLVQSAFNGQPEDQISSHCKLQNFYRYKPEQVQAWNYKPDHNYIVPVANCN